MFELYLMQLFPSVSGITFDLLLQLHISLCCSFMIELLLFIAISLGLLLSYSA